MGKFFRRINNFVSYVWYVLSLDKFQVFSAVVDMAILLYTIFNLEEIFSQPTLLLIVIAVLINLVWQILNVISHFTFIQMESPECYLMPIISRDTKAQAFDDIKVDYKLFTSPYPYEKDAALGVLENPKISELLVDTSSPIKIEIGEKKKKATEAYIHLYKSNLLQFLNHKWHDISHVGGMFTNDAKICLASELFQSKEGHCWRICKGSYYNGYLTNFIFNHYIGGSHYYLYPPMNASNTEIKSLVDSDFSDHIGVSTLLCTSDGWALVFYQSTGAVYAAGKAVPSGSGSLDFADYKPGEDFRQMIIRGAERELIQESSLEKTMKRASWNAHLTTHVLSYYRDMQRGGKPEFCCITCVDEIKDNISEFISANTSELELKKEEFYRITGEDDAIWHEKVLPTASLSLKMTFKAVKEYMAKGE